MGTARGDHIPGGVFLKMSPEQRAAEAERARMLRLIGENLGFNKIAETLKAGTALPRPQGQQRKPPKRATGGGRKRKLPDDVVERGRDFLQRELDLEPGWASNFQACCEHVKNKLKLTCHWHTVATWIVEPVLTDRGLWHPRSKNKRTRFEK